MPERLRGAAMSGRGPDPGPISRLHPPASIDSIYTQGGPVALDSSSPFEPTPEEAVRERYTAAARLEPALCCPVEYDPCYLEVIPAEVLERDYSCGDPSRLVRGDRELLV